MAVFRTVRDRVKKVELLLYFVTALLATYLAVANILRAAKWPDEATWAPGTTWFWLIVACAVYVPLYALYKALDAHFEGADKETATLDRDLELVCQRVVAEIANSCPAVNVNELAAQVWICKEDDTFDRRAFFFLPEKRKRSGIMWRKGKGVAGMAWRAGDDLLADLAPLRAKLSALGDSAFDQLPEDERYGMTAHETKATSRYGGVCAFQLFSQENNASSLLGIFVIDYIGSSAFASVAESSESSRVMWLLGGCEKILTDAQDILDV